MRAQQAIETTTKLVLGLFMPDLEDVAKAIIADADAFAGAATTLGRDSTAEQMAEVIRAIRGDVDDRTADWLAEAADSPGAWFYSRINNHL